MTTIDFLWFDGCPNHAAARALLEDVVGELAPGTPIRDVEASDPAIAADLRFPGSPTIRVDDEDIDPQFRDPGDYTPRCRVFWTPSGLRGVPPRDWIEAAIRRSQAGR